MSLTGTPDDVNPLLLPMRSHSSSAVLPPPPLAPAVSYTPLAVTTVPVVVLKPLSTAGDIESARASLTGDHLSPLLPRLNDDPRHGN